MSQVQIPPEGHTAAQEAIVKRWCGTTADHDTNASQVKLSKEVHALHRNTVVIVVES